MFAKLKGVMKAMIIRYMAVNSFYALSSKQDFVLLIFICGEWLAKAGFISMKQFLPAGLEKKEQAAI